MSGFLERGSSLKYKGHANLLDPICRALAEPKISRGAIAFLSRTTTVWTGVIEQTEGSAEPCRTNAAASAREIRLCGLQKQRPLHLEAGDQ
jgi:hypothetical protein